MSRLLLRAAAMVAAVAAVCFLSASPSRAVTNTTLYSEDFSSSSGFYAWSGYMSSFNGWYWTSYGRGGYNGSIGFQCYYQSSAQSIFSPTIDASSYSTDADSTFIEFDLCMPKNYYEAYYGYPIGAEFTVRVGGTQIAKITKKDFSVGVAYTFSYYSSPSSFTSTYYWKHFRYAIPKASRTAGMQIELVGKGTNDWGWYYPDAQPFWIDNMLVSNNHYTNLTYAPKILNFGELGIGLTSGTQYVIFQNPNSTPINISNISVGGSNASDFQIVYTPGTIPAGMSDSIGVEFNPSYKGFRSASLSFNTDVDIPTSGAVDLLGMCLVPQIALPEGTVVFRKTRIPFDDYIVTSIPIQNSGLAPLILDTGTTYIEGDAAFEYDIVSAPTEMLMPGGIDSIVVKFTPMDEGQQAAYLHLNSNADNGEQVVTLKAVGIVPHLEITPRNIMFDSTDVGGTSEATLTFFNSGSDTLAITNNLLSLSDYDFAADPLMGSDTLIAPGQSRKVTVKFMPLRSGTRVARLHMTTNLPLTFETPRRDTSVFDISMMGYAIPVGILSASALAPDTAIVGIESCQSSSITNTGAAPLTITSATITGRDAAEFTLSGFTLPLTLDLGASQSYSLCTTPTERGDRQAQLVLTGTSNDRPLTVTLPLSAYGLEVCASANTTTAIGSETCAGYTDTATITVTNCGEVATEYTAALASGATSFTIVGNPTSTTVASSGTTTFQVAYTPTARGAESTTLTITGGTGVTPMTIDLHATGGAASIVGSGTAPETAVGSTSASFEVGVQNTGECDFVPGTPSVTGPFAYVSGGDQPIAPGQSGTLMFTFTPTQSGSSVGVVSFPNATGISIPAANVTISGSTPSAGVSAEAYGFSLAQNYPNPFRSKTQVDFVVPYNTRVTLDLLDATGGYIATLYNGVAEQGAHTAMVDASALVGRDARSTGAAMSSGTYFYRLTSQNPVGVPVVLLRQMVLVK